MTEIHATLKDLAIPIDDVRPFDKNPRRGDIKVIRESLHKTGQYRPIVVNKRDKRILAGNHTWLAAKELDWGHIAATFVDVDQKTAKRIVLVDNRSNDVAGYDQMALRELLEGLPSLEGTGYSAADLDALVSELAPVDPGRDTEPGEPPAEPRTKPGDLWLLGEHRLLCGDALKAGDGLFTQAEAVLTDPPYGMNLDTDYTQMLKAGIKSRHYAPVRGDVSAFDPRPVLARLEDVEEQFWFGGDYFYDKLPPGGSWLVWDKRNERSDGLVGNHFEVCWSRQRHRRMMLRHHWAGFTAHDRDGIGRTHPTQKPVALLGRIIGEWITGSVVLDPFAGSGSTFIACENLNRRCYAMEIDPGYCDVIVDRWERHTGRTATLADRSDT